MNMTRLAKLSEALKDAGLDALALNPGPSLAYLTGLHFHLSERPVVMFFPAEGRPGIVLPELEMLKVIDLEDEVRAFPYGEDPATWEGVFAAASRALGLEGKLIGVEPRSMRLLEFLLMQQALGSSEWPEADDIVGSLRLHKDAVESQSIRKAIRIAQEALEATLPQVRIGMTEKELASELVLQLLRHGSEAELPFFPIVSAGPNGANPHAVPSERKLKEGDLLVVDWGAAAEGYISDLTRTFAVGEVEEEYKLIHQTVLEANAAGQAAGKPGAACAEVDKAARAVIDAAGYGEYFTHRTGHGIGLEAHEEPYMRGDNARPLEPGMVYTVEPGIYLPGRNGARIEDNMLVTEAGVECLSDMPRELRQVG
jgi:Xaa-Pro dipeptidase